MAGLRSPKRRRVPASTIGPNFLRSFRQRLTTQCALRPIDVSLPHRGSSPVRYLSSVTPYLLCQVIARMREHWWDAQGATAMLGAIDAAGRGSRLEMPDDGH